MNYGIYKQTYGGQEAYRYRIVDNADRLRYLAEPSDVFLPNQDRLVTFFDPDHDPIGWLALPQYPTGPWNGLYDLFLGDIEQPRATIEEQWGLVDMILLRLPRYVLHVGTRAYTFLGSRYGERLYEIFLPAEGDEGLVESGNLDEEGMKEALQAARERWGEPVGEIVRPTRGPSYAVETEAAVLRQSPLLLASLVVVVDMLLYGDFHPERPF